MTRTVERIFRLTIKLTCWDVCKILCTASSLSLQPQTLMEKV
jgi:hypothetical protein